MGSQIIRQPDGRFAVFSTVVDSLVATDMTRRQLVEQMDARSHRDNVMHVRWVTDLLARGKKPFYQFTMTWEEAVAETERDSRITIGDQDA